MRDERSIQSFDPLGTVGSAPFTAVLAIASAVYGIVQTVVGAVDVVAPAFAVLALAAITIAALITVLGQRPQRIPLTARTFWIAVVLAVTAAVLAVAGSAPSADLDDAWPSVMLGVLVAAHATFRPPREIAGAAVLGALAIGFSVLVRSAASAEPASVVLVLLAMVPVLAIGLGAATYAEVYLRGVDRWRATADAAARRSATDAEDGIARSIQQDRVTVLGHDILPFFADLLERGTVEDADRQRARAIADTVRRIMVADADRSWLDAALEDVATRAGADDLGTETIDDVEGLAASMAPRQRAALRALISAVISAPGFDAAGFGIRFEREFGVVRVRLDAAVTSSRVALLLYLTPYLTVMRVLFDDVTSDLREDSVTLIFSYEQ